MLNQESTEQEVLVKSVDEKMEAAHYNLKQETQKISSTRKLKDDICWMYGVIAIEVTVIIFLIYLGLT
jgi:t-SNARE complex subunit (syntaxin)